MKTLTWFDLFTFSPYYEAIVWGKEKYNEQESQDSVQVIKDLMTDKKLDWANWLIVRLMTRPQYLAYTIYSAKIEAAKKVLENDNEENREIAYTTSRMVYAACAAAYAAAYIVADTAAYAAGNAIEKEKMHIKILNYGIELMEKEK